MQKNKTVLIIVLMLSLIIFSGCGSEESPYSGEEDLIITTFEFDTGNVTFEFSEEDSDSVQTILDMYNLNEDIDFVLSVPKKVFPDDKKKQKYWEDKLKELYKHYSPTEE